MTLKELIELCTTIEEGKILRGKVDGADVNAMSTYKTSKKQPRPSSKSDGARNVVGTTREKIVKRKTCIAASAM